MHIREYLVREAEQISERSLSELGELGDAEALMRAANERRSRFLQMMGIDELLPEARQTPLNATTTGVVQRDGYRIEKLYYQALPRLYVAANLYIPDSLTGPAPGVLYVCGHSETQKFRYQPHARKWAELGFVCLIVDSIWGGEVRGYHHGPYKEGWFHWYSRGYTPAGMELLTGSRGLDLLSAREEVDASRLGVTGISGGGAATWWIAAGDERIGCAASVCGTAGLGSQIRERTIDGHCDCMWFINTARWDYPDLAALIAPRPFIIGNADADGIFEIRSVRALFEKIQRLYELLGAGDKVKLVEYPGPHSYSPLARKTIFAWFIKHLMGREVGLEEVGDVDERPEAQEPDEVLRVFVHGQLADDLTPRIHEEVLRPAPPPVIETAEDVPSLRAGLIEQLRADTFAHFPASPPPLGVNVIQRIAHPGQHGYRFEFTTEDGVRLRGWLMARDSLGEPWPAVVVLRNRGEGRSEPEAFAQGFSGDLGRIVVDVRGTNDTSWGAELNWHVRRAAAWTGRTVASLWTWDLLRALEAVRSLPEVDGERLVIAARGEMCIPAVYAALLDGCVAGVALDSPPATHDQATAPDGGGPMLEMLRVLRYTDLPYAAGLLFPAELAVANPPQTWWWTVRLYQRLGGPGRVHVLSDIRAWRPGILQ